MAINNFAHRVSWILAGFALLIEVMPTQAALVLGSEVTNQGGTNVAAGSNSINILSSPSTSFFGNSLPGGLTNLVPPPLGIDSYNFYDDFIINVPTASVDSFAATVNLGNLFDISNLQFRLYGGSTPTLTPVNVIDGWSSTISAGPLTGTISVLPQTILSSGTYVFEARGLVDGQYGGGYAGILNVSPVPETETWIMMVMGLAIITSLFRRPRHLTQ